MTRKAIQHLVYYGCLVLLDIFSFGAVYAPTAEIGGFVVDESVKEECARYVRVPRMRIGSIKPKLGSVESERSRGGTDERSSISSSSRSQLHSEHTTPSDRAPAPDFSTTSVSWSVRDADSDDEESNAISHMTLITLYTSLRQGLTLKNWVLENVELLGGIDVRRLITFGIIKGFLYRVHKYAIATSTSLPPAPPASLQSVSTSAAVNHNDVSDQATIRGGHLARIPSLVAPTANAFPHPAGERRAEEMVRLNSLVSEEREQGLPLVRFLDGMHCFDEICTELGMSERVVEGKIRGVGEVQVFSR